MVFTGPNAKAQSTNTVTQVPHKVWEILKKRCSIVVMAGEYPSLLESCLQELAEVASVAEHELLLVNDKCLDIDVDELLSIVPNLRLVTPPAESGFEQMCNQAAREASGRYLLFVNRPVKLSREMLEGFIRRLEVESSNIGMSQDKSLILVKRHFVLRFGGLKELFHKAEEQPRLVKERGYHHNLIGNLSRFVQIRGKKVLVVGCAEGLECELIRLCGAKEVIGLDITDRIGKHYTHPAIKYVKASALEIPFDDNTFDICTSIATLEHILEPKAAVEEMVRVVRENEVVYCYAAPLWHSPYGHHKEDIFPNDPWIHLRKKSADQMKSYYENTCNDVVGGDTITGHIDWIYASDYCNRVSVSEYKSIVAQMLSLTSPIHIGFGINLAYKNLLKAEIHDELQEYPAEELLTESLTWVLRKV